MLEQQLEHYSQDPMIVSNLQETIEPLNQIKEDLQEQKRQIIRVANFSMDMAIFQAFTTLPLFLNYFLSHITGANFLTSLASVCFSASFGIFLVMQFKVKNIHYDEKSWFYKIKNKKIQQYFSQKKDYGETILASSQILSNISHQEDIIDYLETNKNHVNIEQIIHYNAQINQLKNEFKEQRYPEALEIIFELLNYIDKNYQNPYGNSEDRETKKGRFNYFKKLL